MSGITLHPGQSEIYSDLFVSRVARFATAVCSRGFGKSYLAGAAACSAVSELCNVSEYIPNKNVAIIAPTYSQVVDIYYPMLAYDFGLEKYATKYSRDLGRFWFRGNVELHLVSYEAVERMRGKGYYFVVGDELSSWTKGVGLKEAWESIIQPCIITRWSPKRIQQLTRDYKSAAKLSPGRALLITTPKGYNYVYDLYNRPELDPLWRSYHFDYTQSPYLDIEEVERIRHTIDPIEFNAEYKALFEDSGHRVFYNFDRKIHVDRDIEDFKDGEDVHIGIDFNVGLQCSSAFAIRGKQPQFIDEFKHLPDTEELAKAIRGRYPKEKHKVFVYPDPTGKARKTSAAVGRTDFSILASYGFQVLARSASPSIVDSVKAVNRLLKTASGAVNLRVHPRCTGIITSLERTEWLDKNPDTAAIDKSKGVEHFSDSVRYPVEYLWPVEAGTKRVARGFGF
jgi:hypothetical protein